MLSEVGLLLVREQFWLHALSASANDSWAPAGIEPRLAVSIA